MILDYITIALGAIAGWEISKYLYKRISTIKLRDPKVNSSISFDRFSNQHLIKYFKARGWYEVK